MIAFAGALCCMMIALGGGFVATDAVALGLLCMGTGAIGLGIMSAAIRLYGFTHFVADEGKGISTLDIADYFSTLEGGRRAVYVQQDGMPTPAVGFYEARYAGRLVLVIEGQPQ